MRKGHRTLIKFLLLELYTLNLLKNLPHLHGIVASLQDNDLKLAAK